MSSYFTSLFGGAMPGSVRRAASVQDLNDARLVYGSDQRGDGNFMTHLQRQTVLASLGEKIFEGLGPRYPHDPESRSREAVGLQTKLDGLRIDHLKNLDEGTPEELIRHFYPLDGRVNPMPSDAPGMELSAGCADIDLPPAPRPDGASSSLSSASSSRDAGPSRGAPFPLGSQAVLEDIDDFSVRECFLRIRQSAKLSPLFSSGDFVRERGERGYYERLGKFIESLLKPESLVDLTEDDMQILRDMLLVVKKRQAPMPPVRSDHDDSLAEDLGDGEVLEDGAERSWMDCTRHKHARLHPITENNEGHDDGAAPFHEHGPDLHLPVQRRRDSGEFSLGIENGDDDGEVVEAPARAAPQPRRCLNWVPIAILITTVVMLVFAASLCWPDGALGGLSMFLQPIVGEVASGAMAYLPAAGHAVTLLAVATLGTSLASLTADSGSRMHSYTRIAAMVGCVALLVLGIAAGATGVFADPNVGTTLIGFVSGAGTGAVLATLKRSAEEERRPDDRPLLQQWREWWQRRQNQQLARARGYEDIADGAE